MSHAQSIDTRTDPEPIPANIKSTQPGGGRCYSIELAWGRLRRLYLKVFRRGYLQRMGEKRRGSVDGCPIEVLDPRDLKYFKNQCDAHWLESDDPFRWRESLPFARWGLCELMLMGVPLLEKAGLAHPPRPDSRKNRPVRPSTSDLDAEEE